MLNFLACLQRNLWGLKEEEIQRLARDIALDDRQSVERSSHAIRAIFDAGRLPGEIIDAVKTALTFVGEGAVAVRSSAPGEDSPSASFAGQHETFLSIREGQVITVDGTNGWIELEDRDA